MAGADQDRLPSARQVCICFGTMEEEGKQKESNHQRKYFLGRQGFSKGAVCEQDTSEAALLLDQLVVGGRLSSNLGDAFGFGRSEGNSHSIRDFRVTLGESLRFIVT